MMPVLLFLLLLAATIAVAKVLSTKNLQQRLRPIRVRASRSNTFRRSR